MENNKAFSNWMDFYCEQQLGMTWPNETLVRFFKANYMPGFLPDYSGRKVLDVGFGTGNNLMFCATLDMELYGVEVHEEICLQTIQRMADTGYKADLRSGTNSEIPFSDNFFDYIVSWDVIHYEGSEDRVLQAIREYNRVLKPGGRLYLSTVAPDHTILRGSKTLGNHRYEIGREDDFRKGESFFYFDSPNYLNFYFSELFSDIRVGRVTLDYFDEINDTFILTAVNGK